MPQRLTWLHKTTLIHLNKGEVNLHITAMQNNGMVPKGMISFCVHVQLVDMSCL